VCGFWNKGVTPAGFKVIYSLVVLPIFCPDGAEQRINVIGHTPHSNDQI